MKGTASSSESDESKQTSLARAEILNIQDENQRLRLEVAEMQWKEEALRESEKRFRNIALSMVVWIWEMDLNGIYTYCSERVEDILGFSPDEITGKNFTSFLPEKFQDNALSQFYAFVKDRAIIKDWELLTNHKDSQTKCVMTSGVPIIDGHGELIGYRGVHKDITEQKNAEEALMQANDRLQRFDRLKSEFVSMVSHEIRTPITIIREGVSLCLDGIVGDMTKQQKEILSDTFETVGRLDRLVTDLLDLSKIEEGKIKLHRSVIDLGEMAQKMRQHFQAQAQRKEISLQLQLPDHEMPTFADKDKIIQIFQNLVSNAIRYTKSGGKINIGIEEEVKFYKCWISDTGVGIAHENIPKLFSKFEQFGRLEGSGYKGTGLGLAIAKGMVEKHDGKIWVESTLGQGTTFYFTLQKASIPRVRLYKEESEKDNRIESILKSSGLLVDVVNASDPTFKHGDHSQPSLIVIDSNASLNIADVQCGCEFDKQKSCTIPIVTIGGAKNQTRNDSKSDFIIVDSVLCDDELRERIFDIISEQYAQKE